MDKWSNDNWDKFQKLLDVIKQDGFFNKTKVNERFYSGDQWFHLSIKNKIPRIIINFIKRIVNFLVSAIMGTEIKLNYSPQPYLVEEGNEEQKEKIKKYNEYSDILNRHSSVLYEQLKMGQKNEEMIKDSILSGIGLIHIFWNDNLISGNDTIIKGEMDAEVINGVDFLPGDQNLVSIQKQTINHITYRENADLIKKIAKKNGVPAHLIELIQPDPNSNEATFDKGENEPTDSKNTTVVLTYERKDDGFVYMSKRVKAVVFEPEKNTQKKMFPIIYMNGELRKSWIYGTSQITEVIPNQIYVNTLYAMAMVSAQKTAYPTTAYDKTKISGISNGVGMNIGIDGPIGDAVKMLPTGQISTDVYNLVDNVVAKTKENQNANDALLGNLRPENTSAMLLSQEQSALPLKTINRRFYDSQEDFGLISEEFMRIHMVTARPLKLKDSKGNEEYISFRGSDYADIKQNVKIDVGASTQYNEIISVNTMNDWLNNGHMTFVEVLERYPKQLVPLLQQLIDSRVKEENQVIKDEIPPEILLQIENLPLEEQKQILDEYKRGEL